MRLIDGRYLQLVFAYVMACKVILWWAIRADFLYAFRKSSRLHERKLWLLYIFFGLQTCFKMLQKMHQVCFNIASCVFKLLQCSFKSAPKLFHNGLKTAPTIASKLLHGCFECASKFYNKCIEFALQYLQFSKLFQRCFRMSSKFLQLGATIASKLLQNISCVRHFSLNNIYIYKCILYGLCTQISPKSGKCMQSWFVVQLSSLKFLGFLRVSFCHSMNGIKPPRASLGPP